MPDPSDDRPDNREVEDDDLKPAVEGQPWRPPTDPGSGDKDGDIGPQSLRDTPKVG